jgi:hypothetical protein
VIGSTIGYGLGCPVGGLVGMGAVGGLERSMSGARGGVLDLLGQVVHDPDLAYVLSQKAPAPPALPPAGPGARLRNLPLALLPASLEPPQRRAPDRGNGTGR